MMNSILILTVTSCVLVSAKNLFRPIVEWKQLDFLFPSREEALLAMSQGRLIPQNCTPVDVDVNYGCE